MQAYKAFALGSWAAIGIVIGIVGVFVILLLSSGHGNVDVAKFIIAEVIAFIVLALLALIPAIFGTIFFMLGERFWKKRVASGIAFTVGLLSGGLALAAALAYFAYSKELSIHSGMIFAALVLLGLSAIALFVPFIVGKTEENGFPVD
jgi:hypothetical protein